MKRFRTVTIITLSAILILVVANICYLHGLYSSIKQQTLQTATECLRRADISELLARMQHAQNGHDFSSITLPLRIQGEKSADGIYSYSHFLDKVNETLSNCFHIISSSATDIPERKPQHLEDFYRQELAASGLYPKSIIVTDPFQATTLSGHYWKVTIGDVNEPNAVTAYISPLIGYVFHKMAGIIVTSFMILILMAFLIWYLLHWVSKLRSIEQMKDDFTHNMTHELKTPVAVAYSAADSMLRYYDQSDEERNKKFLSIIMQRLNFLSGMIENILSMSMERFKTMHFTKERIALRPLVEEVAGMIEMKANKPVNINIEIPENAFVTTDSLHFGNMISNLLDNAVKYSGDKVAITISGDNRKISVTDNGIGISSKCKPYIFDKFYRVTDGNKYEVGGYGLGLYYVKQIAEMQGWTISVESEENKGSIFTINFNGHEER